ncbi:hypothetical protein Hanom_Chr00s004379g01721661 [Helianthus anomalus]
MYEEKGEEMENKPLRTVSISAPARRAALTAFSSLRAAAVGAFLRITTGSQSCAMWPDMFVISLRRRRR